VVLIPHAAARDLGAGQLRGTFSVPRAGIEPVTRGAHREATPAPARRYLDTYWLYISMSPRLQPTVTTSPDLTILAATT
jgi:hypothetical protein